MAEHMIAYTSRCVIPPAYQQVELAALVDTSRIRNAAAHVTGALIFTEERFAQTIEGPAESVRSIMGSILRDNRHADIVVIHDGAVAGRRFHRWSLAYQRYDASLDTLIQAAAFEATLTSGRSANTLLREMERLCSNN